MWIAKIKLDSQKTLMGKNALENNVSLIGFPLSQYIQAPWIFVNLAGTIFGAEIDKKNFIKSMKNENRVVNIEANGDFIIATVKDPDYLHPFYDKGIIHVSPALISNNGYEVVTLGSFDRNKLMEIAEDGIVEILDFVNGFMGEINFSNDRAVSIRFFFLDREISTVKGTYLVNDDSISLVMNSRTLSGKFRVNQKKDDLYLTAIYFQIIQSILCKIFAAL